MHAGQTVAPCGSNNLQLDAIAAVVHAAPTPQVIPAFIHEQPVTAFTVALAQPSKLVRGEQVHCREHQRGEHAIHMQTFGSQAAELAYASFFGLPLNESEEYLGRIAALTSDDVQAAATKYLDSSRIWIGAVRGK